MLCMNNRLLYKVYMQAHIINLKTYQSGDVDFTADKPGEDPIINSHTHNTHTYTYMKYSLCCHVSEWCS